MKSHTAIPEEPKLSDAQILDVLWKLTVNYKDLRDQVNVMWNELVHHSGEMNLKGDWHGLDKRLKEAEEQIDGITHYISSALKEMGGGLTRRRHKNVL